MPKSRKNKFIELFPRFLLTILVLILTTFILSSQNDTTKRIYKRFYYPNGNVSSEGYLENNKPNGYWKTYYENGVLKSEGNRVNFELDGLWKFYDNNGNLTLEINYKQGKKNGLRITHLKDERIEETFVDDVKNGPTRHYFKDGKLKKEVNFINGKEEGIEKEYDREGNIILLTHYKNGFVTKRDFINRRNSQGNKHGTWMYFNENGVVIKEENYKNGLLHGFTKIYDNDGNLVEILKYENGELVVEAEETKQYEILYDYYESGKPKIIGSYIDGKPDGIRREFDEKGKIERSYFFRKGVLLYEGIFDNLGRKQGYFREYYENGNLKAEGEYKNNIKIKKWIYYYPNGQIEQTGNYTLKGEQDGEWIMFYENGKIFKKEYFESGKREGPYVEYDTSGVEITKGQFFDDQETGEWFYISGDVIEKGKYEFGEKTGLWTTLDKETGRVLIENRYNDGLLNGHQVYYYPDGKKRLEGKYVMGLKEGDWIYYNENGDIELKVTYKNGIEKAYNKIDIDKALNLPPQEYE